MPKPAATTTLVREMTMDEVVEYMNRRAGEPKPITGACWVDGKVYLRLAVQSLPLRRRRMGWPGSGGRRAVLAEVQDMRQLL